MNIAFLNSGENIIRKLQNLMSWLNSVTTKPPLYGRNGNGFSQIPCRNYDFSIVVGGWGSPPTLAAFNDFSIDFTLRPLIFPQNAWSATRSIFRLYD